MKEFTIPQVAEKKKRNRTTVLRWVQNHLFPNARLVESPLGNYWLIPERDVEQFEIPKRGPKK